jgi:acyl-CoA thioesterase-1
VIIGNETGEGDIHYYVIQVRYAILLSIIALAACSTEPKAAVSDEAQRVPVETKPDTQTDTRHRLVAFGDSLTAGFGVEHGLSYPDFLQKLIDAKQYPWRVINAGVSGDTTTDGLARLPGLLEYKPEIVLLELGANDGLRGIPVDATRANLDTIITSLENAGAKVILAGMTLPPNYGPDYIKPFENVFTSLASQHGIPLIPFLLDGVGGQPAMMQRDGLHPNAEGNRRVAENVMRTLESLLSE